MSHIEKVGLCAVAVIGISAFVGMWGEVAKKTPEIKQHPPKVWAADGLYFLPCSNALILNLEMEPIEVGDDVTTYTLIISNASGQTRKILIPTKLK